MEIIPFRSLPGSTGNKKCLSHQPMEQELDAQGREARSSESVDGGNVGTSQGTRGMTLKGMGGFPDERRDTSVSKDQ